VLAQVGVDTGVEGAMVVELLYLLFVGEHIHLPSAMLFVFVSYVLTHKSMPAALPRLAGPREPDGREPVLGVALPVL
jgi:hypothetical protein